MTYLKTHFVGLEAQECVVNRLPDRGPESSRGKESKHLFVIISRLELKANFAPMRQYEVKYPLLPPPTTPLRKENPTQVRKTNESSFVTLSAMPTVCQGCTGALHGNRVKKEKKVNEVPR